MGVYDNGNDHDYLMNRPYSPENAEYLVSIVSGCMSRLNSIMEQMPDIDSNGFSDYTPQSHLYAQKDEQVRQLISYRDILRGYRQAAERTMSMIRSRSDRIKNDTRLLNSRSVRNLYIDSQQGLYEQYTRHKDTKNQINNMLDHMQSSVKGAAAGKPPGTRPPDSDFSAITADSIFEMEAGGHAGF